ncbi:hypothetical protein [Bremerella alba]|uniref:Uncharacterized protein n=1 Tax=Bremerella alba TaxID=980252 RepID=A0A7V8V7Y7_9BACT|nr:hypothetical protein [Bremerella alba]MBA2116620.1 hypothetical protein [Bremerella alba]
MDAITTIQSQLDFFLPQHPHWLIPRTGLQMVKMLHVLDCKSFQTWRYWEDPSSSVTLPTATLRTDSETSGFFNRQWREEAFGFLFPELAYVPINSHIELFSALTKYCQALSHGCIPRKGIAKQLWHTLLSTEWIAFPLAVSPFMEEAATDYCLVLVNNKEAYELIEIEFSGDSKVFQWKANFTDWPIPAEAEDLAHRMWNEELSQL